MNLYLVEYLQKLLQFNSPTLTLTPDAFIFFESFLFMILNKIQAFQPHTLQDIEKIVLNTFTSTYSKNSIQENHTNIEKTHNKPYNVLFDKISITLQREYLPYRINNSASMFLACLLEYVSIKILKQIEIYVGILGRRELTKEDLNLVVYSIDEFEKVLSAPISKNPTPRPGEDHLEQNILSNSSYYSNHYANTYDPNEELEGNKQPIPYDALVKLFIDEETLYIKDLKLMIKAFKKLFQIKYSHDMDLIFSNIDDIYNLSFRMLWMLEDEKYSQGDGGNMCIGSILEDLTMCAEFDVYDLYAEQLLDPDHLSDIENFLEAAGLQSDNKAQSPFVSEDVWRYVLPHLLHGPIVRCFHYFRLTQNLILSSPNAEDRNSLTTANISLEPLQAKLNKMCPDWFPRRITPLNSIYWKQWMRLDLNYSIINQHSTAKFTEVKKCIEGWDDIDNETSSQLLMEGHLGKVPKGGGLMKVVAGERYAFVFDDTLILCKPSNTILNTTLYTGASMMRRTSLTPTPSNTTAGTAAATSATASTPGSQQCATNVIPDFKIKEWFRYKSLRTKPRDDIPEYPHSFELSYASEKYHQASGSPTINQGTGGAINSDPHNSLTLFARDDGERSTWLSLLIKLSLDE